MEKRFFVFLNSEGSEKRLFGVSRNSEEKDKLYSAVACCQFGGEMRGAWQGDERSLRYGPKRIKNVDGPGFWQATLSDEQRLANTAKVKARAAEIWGSKLILWPVELRGEGDALIALPDPKGTGWAEIESLTWGRDDCPVDPDGYGERFFYYPGVSREYRYVSGNEEFSGKVYPAVWSDGHRGEIDLGTVQTVDGKGLAHFDRFGDGTDFEEKIPWEKAPTRQPTWAWSEEEDKGEAA